MRRRVVGAVMFLVVFVIAMIFLSYAAKACTVDVGTVLSDVYVRDLDTGKIVGSLYKGDKVIVEHDLKKGYVAISINGKSYKVFGEYLSIEREVNEDEVSLTPKIRKSKSGGKAIRNATPHSIKGSEFEGVYFW